MYWDIAACVLRQDKAPASSLILTLFVTLRAECGLAYS